MGLLRYLLLAFAGVTQCLAQSNGTKPNIVLIFTDDQDLRLGSIDHMPILQKELIQKGTQFTNHYATIALCCPSRASLLRGQAAHNTNITNVDSPGGNYQKFMVSGESDDYLPHWLVSAGYNAEYVGKFMNGYTRANYQYAPKGWTYTDLLVDPFTYLYNNVVMSQNGETPIHYKGFHQLDVIRTKALDRIDQLSTQNKPFYLTIAPSAPHVQGKYRLPNPQARYKGSAAGLQMSRGGNWNASDESQAQKPSWLKELGYLDSILANRIDNHYQARIEILQGVDEIIQDVVDRLDKHGILDNTYIIYTSDNGYHLGNHRVSAGKTLPYREDTNMPLIIRGPQIKANATSNAPSAHTDFAPTFLEIAGVNSADFPPFLDGQSRLSNWHNPQTALPTCPLNGTQEVINVEFWGSGEIENLLQEKPSNIGNNSYKTLRIAGEEKGYLYSKWCTGEEELYDTTADPYELQNLAKDPEDETTKQLLNRLNALLLATKSCADATCRNPWKLLQPEEGRRGTIVDDDTSLTITCLDQAMDPKYDSHFNDTSLFPRVAFQECMEYQDITNEAPYLPQNPGLGMAYRKPTDNYYTPSVKLSALIVGNAKDQGGPEQRNVTLAQIMAQSMKLTQAQIGQAS
ncbi:arylsulfatase [Annulohypoxylon truncatum]|uniref:arylsulfatase n=1 Tax=Annulohypoxylon truncatum TaxID=327061 RepID=UPI0020075A73|nr:arylsulfatase [Annulohypoxylon truncatum]KAI1210551.1 arylsulfatase [Annulohypoxylon truncatum]